MQRTVVIRRILGDLMGSAILAVLVGTILYALPIAATGIQRRNLFLPAYGALLVGGYACWVQVDRRNPNMRWLSGIIYSLYAGLILLVIDILVGLWRDPKLPPLEAALSTEVMFAVTLLFCPGFTCIALAGWARSLIIHTKRAWP